MKKGKEINMDNEIYIEKIRSWIFKIYKLSEDTELQIKHNEYIRKDSNTNAVDLILLFGEDHRHEYTIHKPLSNIIFKDIELMKKEQERELIKKHPIRGRIARIFGWWFIFSGALTLFSICPFCGQPGCVVGAGSVGVVALFFSLVKNSGRWFIDIFRNKIWNHR